MEKREAWARAEQRDRGERRKKEMRGGHVASHTLFRDCYSNSRSPWESIGKVIPLSASLRIIADEVMTWVCPCGIDSCPQQEGYKRSI